MPKGKLKSRYTSDELTTIFKEYVDSHEDQIPNETYETPKETATEYIDGLVEFMKQREKAKIPLWSFEVDDERGTTYIYKGKKCVEMIGASDDCRKMAEWLCNTNNA